MDTKNRFPDNDLFRDVLIIDFDGSVSLPFKADKLDMRNREEEIRYSASFNQLEILENEIKEQIRNHKIFFLGNGDFHHISYLLIKNILKEPFQVIVFDNHPDNMIFPFGIHCGSWVYHASKLPNVLNTSVFGIASADIKGINIIQNHYSAIKTGRVKYYCLSPVPKLTKFLSSYKIEEKISSKNHISEILKKHVQSINAPVYLSIDKDVLSKESLKTTWDQGELSENDLLQCVREILPYVFAVDIVGDISSHDFKSHLKKIMKWLDGEKKFSPPSEKEHLRHTDFNMKLISLIKGIDL